MVEAKQTDAAAKKKLFPSLLLASISIGLFVATFLSIYFITASFNFFFNNPRFLMIIIIMGPTIVSWAGMKICKSGIFLNVPHPENAFSGMIIGGIVSLVLIYFGSMLMGMGPPSTFMFVMFSLLFLLGPMVGSVFAVTFLKKDRSLVAFLFLLIFVCVFFSVLKYYMPALFGQAGAGAVGTLVHPAR